MGKAPRKPAKIGRPPLPAAARRDRQARPLYLKLTPAERAELDAAAERAAAPISVWARELLLRAARR